MEGQYTALDSNLEPMVSAKHDPDEEEITRTKRKGGKSGQYLFLLLVVFAIIATIIAVIGLAIALGVRSSQSQSQPSSQTGGPTMPPTGGLTTVSPTASGPDTCTTQGCVQLAAQISSAMNQSIDPCQNFYQFSCGNWGQRNLIPPGREVQNQLIKPQLTIYERLANIIVNGNSGGLEAVGKAFDLYRSCMDAAAIESLGATPLLNFTRDSLGGWPLIGIPDTSSPPWSINSTYFFYEKALGSFALFNLKPFFNAVTQSRSKYALHFEQQILSLTDLSLDTTKVAAILSQLNASVNITTYIEALQNVFEFDQKLSEIREPRSKVPDIMNGDAVPLLNESNIYTINRLQTLWPGFNWEGFINYIFVDLSGLEVPENLEIVVTTPAYFERLGPLLQNTSQETVRDYTKIFFMLFQFSSLSRQFAGQRNNFTDPTPGDLVACVTFVQRTLPIALARPFVEQFVPEGTREGVMMMIDYILQGFKERVNQMDWLSDLSKQRSIEKVEAITPQAAYPVQIFDDDYVNGLYSRFTANPNDFYGNRLRSTELGLRLRLNLTYGFDKTAWPTDPDFLGYPTLVNAAYNRQGNQIYVMAAIANEPAFRADWPDYSLFGGLGAIVGHEITHGFDNNGQQYDKDGVRRMWWSNESQVQFNSRLQCFVDQYNQYTFEGIQVNGLRTLPENVADNGGLHASFQAYRMRAAMAPQQSLPSLPYTPEQLFFIAYGQTWCELALPSYYQTLRDTDPHAPGPARARAVVNSPEFAEAFNCPAGSPMNPTNKCIIW